MGGGGGAPETEEGTPAAAVSESLVPPVLEPSPAAFSAALPAALPAALGGGAKRGAAILVAALARCLESLRSHCAASAVGGEAVWQRKRARSRSRASTLSSGGEEAPRAAPAGESTY